jgi:hypothetical protein
VLLMSALFDSPKIPASPPPPPAPLPSDTAAQQTAQQQATMEAQAAGRTSTLLTSGQGDTSTPTIAKKTLLGG